MACRRSYLAVSVLLAERNFDLYEAPGDGTIRAL
jgi:hypothetical protein